MRRLIEIIDDLNNAELSVVRKHKLLIRPSSGVFLALGIFYGLSPVDIIPEAYLAPKIFGFIDDLIILTIVGVIVYSDIERMIRRGFKRKNSKAKGREEEVTFEVNNTEPCDIPSDTTEAFDRATVTMDMCDSDDDFGTAKDMGDFLRKAGEIVEDSDDDDDEDEDERTVS